MVISPLATYVNLTKNYTAIKNKVNDTVTIHCFVGQVTAKRGVDYFMNSNQSSCQYVVGTDGLIGCSVPEDHRAWTTGGKYTVNGETGSKNDRHAITIEVACDTYYPYKVNKKAMEALIALLVDICERNPQIGTLKWLGNKDLVGQPQVQNMTAHRWFAPKECPGQYLYERFGYIAETVNSRLEAKRDMTKEDTIKLIEEMEEKKYYKCLDDVPASYKPTIQALMEAGVITGYDGGPDGLIATIGDNTIRVDETFCRIFTILSRPGTLEVLKKLSKN